MSAGTLKTYYTAREISAFDIPEFPCTESGVIRLFKKKGITGRKRVGRGGGVEYPLDVLPHWARIHIAQMARLEQSKKSVKAKPKPIVEADKMGHARCFILQDINTLSETAQISRAQAINSYCALYNAGNIEVQEWVSKSIKTLSPRSVRRWYYIQKQDGNSALANMKYGPKNKSIFDKDKNLQSFIVAQITARPHIRATVLHQGIIAGDFHHVPSLRYLQMYVKKWREDNARRLLAVSNPDAHRSKYEPAFGSRSGHLTRVNQLWEIDGTIADVKCLTPSGEQTRYSLIGLIDVFSRRSKVLVTRQPSAIAVGLLLRQAILEWGLPEILKADNGKDYTAEHVGRIATDLGFHINYCTPFRPMEKPHIERFFGTLTRDLFEIMPAYVGHSVYDRQALRSRQAMGQRHGTLETWDIALNGGELQAVINSWVDDKYSHSEHDGIKTTPFLKGQEGGDPVLFKDERALDLLLAASPGQHGIRTIQKSGINVNGHTYISDEIGGMIGEKVHIKFDPEDETQIIVYTADRKDFICIAKDPTMTDMERQAVAKRAKQAQHQENKVFRAEMRAAQEAHNPDDLAASILRHYSKKSGKVLPFKKPADTPDTPAFVRERKAAAAIGSPLPPPQPITEEQRDARRDYLAKIEERDAKPETVMLTRADGSQRPVILDDIEYIKWLQIQFHTPDGIHPEDLEDLRQYLDEGGRALHLQIDVNGLSEFVNKISGELE